MAVVLRVAPGPVVSASPGFWYGMHILGPQPRLTESGILGAGPGNLHWNVFSVFSQAPSALWVF